MTEFRLRARESVCRCAKCHDSEGSFKRCACGAQFHEDCAPCPTLGCKEVDDDEAALEEILRQDRVAYPPEKTRRDHTKWPYVPQYLGICGGCGRGRMPGPAGWSATKCGNCQDIQKGWAEHDAQEAFWGPIANFISWGALITAICVAVFFIKNMP